MDYNGPIESIHFQPWAMSMVPACANFGSDEIVREWLLRCNGTLRYTGNAIIPGETVIEGVTVKVDGRRRPTKEVVVHL